MTETPTNPAPAGGRNAELVELFRILGALPGGAPRGDNVHLEWLHQIAVWVVGGSGGSRLPELTAHLRADPAAAKALHDVLRAVLADADAVRLFAEAGLPARTSLASEAFVRIVRFVVPRAGYGGDLLDKALRVTAARQESRMLVAVSGEDVADFLDATGLTDCGEFGGLYDQFAESVAIHCTRCAAIGHDADVRRAVNDGRLARSSFHRLGVVGTTLYEAAVARDAEGALDARRRVEDALAAARRDTDVAYAHLETAGVSTDMILRLDLLQRSFDRIETSLPVLAPRPGESKAKAVATAMQVITANIRREAQFLSFLRDRTRLLAKTIVERCGATGTHYITVGARQWWEMAGRGAGGGIVIGFVVWAKVWFHSMHPPPGVLTVLTFFDYATGFLLIHALHLTLATKQPPMTAAALAEALSTGSEERTVEPVVRLVQRICRSQIAGLLGNVVATAITALALDMSVRAYTGHTILTGEEAAEALAGHDPLGSLCLLFAVVTGSAVWLSSMVAGWAENAAHYGRLTESLGSARGGRLMRWHISNIGGVAGNVSLALFLVMISFAGKVTGIPWDVRHVTVSTGQVTMALHATDELTRKTILVAAAGVLSVGLLNIITGFALSFIVAVRARKVRVRFRLALVPALLSALVRQPLRFLLPVGDSEPEAAAKH